MKIAGSGSISQRHGSVDPDPVPHKNFMDPEQRFPHEIPFMTPVLWHRDILVRIRITSVADRDPYPD
jgi:hypothetical protein